MQTLLWSVADFVLAGLLLALGWAAVTSSDARRGVVLFIAFGLLLAVVWARLHAPDLALAEAAIGAGLTGALLLAALRDAPEPAQSTKPASRRGAGLVNVLVLALGVAFAWSLLNRLDLSDAAPIANLVAENLADSGVSNPVTAVLLNFRAYDTLLELAVLLAAALGITALGPERAAFQPAGPVLRGLLRWLVPLLIVTAGYLLWVGAHAPGGAFQAGAMLAAAAVLLRLCGYRSAGLPGADKQRALLAGGIGVFLAVGLATTASGSAFLQYPKDWAGVLILLIEAAAMLAVSTALALAYIGGQMANRHAVLESPRGTASRGSDT